MWKWIYVGGIGASVLVGLVLVASSMSDFTMRHPRSPDVKISVRPTGAIPVKDISGTHGRVRETEESLVHDFGVMDPKTHGEHVFTLTNDGPGILRLRNMGTSCTKCTVASMSKSELAAGESAQVKVEFDCGPGPHYSQVATIGVENDPLTSSIQLRVEGRVRMHFGAEPEELLFSTVPSGKSASAKSLIYSQMFDSAEVIEVKTSKPDFTAELAELEPDAKLEQNPSWARYLNVTVPDNLPSGHFSELVWITLRLPAKKEGDAGEIVRVDVPVKGNVSRGIQITGKEIDSLGVITLGVLPKGVEKKIKLTLKIQNKADRDLKLQRVECKPEFIQVKIEPKPDINPDLGLYDIYLTIPADAPECNFMREKELGQIRIVSENPFLGELPLAVLFAVREDG